MDYHEPLSLLTDATMDYHRVLRSIIEELEAIDWYHQRAVASNNSLIIKLMEHNRNEEIEHACLGLEWLRRNRSEWSGKIDKYMNNDNFEKEITKLGIKKISSELYPKEKRFKGVSLKKDKDGVYVCTHRARSKSYPSKEDIPESVIQKIKSTG
ncbi:MAG: ferritin [archaeon]